jgi:peptidoglycan/xylan/chitin deacetylase (PgdA/CDA1 family)
MTSAAREPTPDGEVVVLLYHAIASPRPGAVPDPHYTLPADRFERQLDAIVAAGGGSSAADGLRMESTVPVLITFDDGRESDYASAFPLLVKRGLRADFFVNPARVGTPGYCGWSQLREMAMAGMSIQSHGWDHRYFTDLAPQALDEDLRRSRQEIEDRVGQPVTLVAPPGGRAPRGLVARALRQGYTHVLGSRPGRWRRADGSPDVPRFALTAVLADSSLQRWLSGDRVALARIVLRWRVLETAKHVLGDRAYERVRARLLGAPGGRAT